MTTQFLPGGLFDSFPEPVLLLAEGQVAYRNPAAADLFPESAPGGAAPEELARLLAGAQPPAVVSGDLGGRSWTVSLQDPGQGLLAVLQRDPGVCPGAFNEAFTAEKFADVLFSLMLSALLRQDYDPSTVLELVRRTLYGDPR